MVLSLQRNDDGRENSGRVRKREIEGETTRFYMAGFIAKRILAMEWEGQFKKHKKERNGRFREGEI